MHIHKVCYSINCVNLKKSSLQTAHRYRDSCTLLNELNTGEATMRKFAADRYRFKTKMPKDNILTFSSKTFKRYCNRLRKQHPGIAVLHATHGYPPFWKRENSFESLCKTIIEQQVSLASAQSVFSRLKACCPTITPEHLLALDAESWRRAGVTRQKTRYLRLLAETVAGEPRFFSRLEALSDHDARAKLLQVVGIGHWTANVYMLVALNRRNVYPDHDVALINSIAHEAFGGETIDNARAAAFIEQFRPLRSIASCYYYHAYILRKKVSYIP